MINNIDLVNKAINYIEEHLFEKPELEDVANAVHYSKYYLHRIFTSTIGMTIHDYIQRRQLTEAANLLVFSKKPIASISHIAGYETQQAFTTIFKAMYKQSPNQFRENKEFYPLQLKFIFNNQAEPLGSKKTNMIQNIIFATKYDIPMWMELVHIVIDGFPYLKEKEYIKVLKKLIENKRALIMKTGTMAIGIMMICYKTGYIDFLGVHPLYKKYDISKLFIDRAKLELLNHNQISITTYREGDKADTGHRKVLKELGFKEAELLTEFGYPTQKFIIDKSGNKG